MHRIRLPRWLRLQFSLRSLLIATIGFCLVLGWHVERVRRQRQAVAALTEAGAYIDYCTSDEDPFAADPPDPIKRPGFLAEWAEWSMPDRLRTALGVDFFRGVDSVVAGRETDLATDLSYLRDLPGIRSLKLGFVLDEDLAIIGSLGSLTHFEASDFEASKQGHLSITDAGMAHLAQLQNLEYLDLSYNLITDAGLARLAKLKRLKHLGLSHTSVGDAGIFHLADMQDLEFLDLNGTKVTDAGLVYLAKLRRLKHLALSDTGIGDTGLAILAKRPNLEFLEVGSTGVTDRGLAPLRSLTGLKDLDLSRTAISDKSSGVIGDMRSLNRVNISQSDVTPEGAAWLRRHLPKTEVNFWGIDRGSAAFRSIDKLVEARRWGDALGAMNKLDKSVVENYGHAEHAALSLARCHAQLGQWDNAAQHYRRALEKLSGRDSHASTVWQELDVWPPVYERVARGRPNDVWRWTAPAQRAVIEGRWSDAAAGYARAIKCPHEVVNVFDFSHAATDTHIDFEYGASRILAGDLSEHRRVCACLIDAHQRAVEMDADWVNAYRNNLVVAVHLWLLAPQGAVSLSQLGARRKPRIHSHFASWRR